MALATVTVIAAAGAAPQATGTGTAIATGRTAEIGTGTATATAARSRGKPHRLHDRPARRWTRGPVRGLGEGRQGGWSFMLWGQGQVQVALEGEVAEEQPPQQEPEPRP
jgi:hypothetical protein